MEPEKKETTEASGIEDQATRINDLLGKISVVNLYLLDPAEEFIPHFPQDYLTVKRGYHVKLAMLKALFEEVSDFLSEEEFNSVNQDLNNLEETMKKYPVYKLHYHENGTAINFLGGNWNLIEKKLFHFSLRLRRLLTKYGFLSIKKQNKRTYV